MTDEQSDVIRGDRFSGGPAREFLSSLAADERIFEADLAVDRAHVIMLAEEQIIEPATAGAILTALDEIEAAGYETLPEGEDVHAAIETAVIDRVGADGGRMHTARSRNDEVATCLRYQLRADLLALLGTLIDLRETILASATEETTTVMPGYTHLQPAQPITVGFWLASYESTLRRDTERLFDAYPRINRSPLGSAALAGTAFEIDRTRTADLLGFDAVIENAMDATTTRDVFVETLAGTTTLATTLAGAAEDVIVFANRGLIELDDRYASTSSIMPQKKNPDTLELVRATAGDVHGALTGLVTTLKGLPRAYNRDLQRATPHVWAAIDAITEAAAVFGGAIETATWNDQQLQAAASEGFTTATGVADTLTKAGLPFRQAHEIVAEAARQLGDNPTEPAILEALNTAAVSVRDEPLRELVDEQAIVDALTLETNLRMRDSYGGTAPESVTAGLKRAKTQLTEHKTHHEDHNQQLAAATEQRQQAMTKYR